MEEMQLELVNNYKGYFPSIRGYEYQIKEVVNNPLNSLIRLSKVSVFCNPEDNP